MKSVIAVGAEGKSSFSVLSKDGLYVSGPLENLAETLKNYIRENEIIPDYIACDSHPDYSSTLLAQKLQQEHNGSRLIQVQHHFAHIVSCMSDNHLDQEVIGVAFDGTGYGADGQSWGGEFLLCARQTFRRLKHLKYVAQPGGDIAAREGWRMALAYLLLSYGQKLAELKLDLLARLEKNKISIIRQMIEKEVNSPLTSSAGRLFDAVSSIIGVADVSQFEAEAAIKLEKAACPGIAGYYNFELAGEEINLAPMIREIVQDLEIGLDRGIISAKFHNTLGEIIFTVSALLSQSLGIKQVVVSGGCFQNQYLSDYLTKRFADSGLNLFMHKRYSTTDLGLSVGQAVVAANI